MTEDEIDVEIEKLPNDMVDALKARGARAAYATIVALSVLEIQFPDLLPVKNADGLLQLGAALQLSAWERMGFGFHREVGLPDAPTAIERALAVMAGDREASPELVNLVASLSVERFSWHAHEELGAEIAIDDVDQKALLLHFADFVWQQITR